MHRRELSSEEPDTVSARGWVEDRPQSGSHVISLLRSLGAGIRIQGTHARTAGGVCFQAPVHPSLAFRRAAAQHQRTHHPRYKRRYGRQ